MTEPEKAYLSFTDLVRSVTFLERRDGGSKSSLEFQIDIDKNWNHAIGFRLNFG